MARHALSLLINQLQACVRSRMQMCVASEGTASQKEGFLFESLVLNPVTCAGPLTK